MRQPDLNSIMMARGYSIKYGKRKAKARSNEIDALERKSYKIESKKSEDCTLFTDENTKNQVSLI